MKKVAVITASDSGYAKKREDVSGPLVQEIVQSRGYEIAEYRLLPDDEESLALAMIDIADGGKADLILTTGGTGFSPRDCMPEATKRVIQREVPGIPEAMRHFSVILTKRAMLSRGVAGIRGKTLIVNLPGSPKAVKECLEYIIEELEHGLEILAGDAGDCARS